MPFGEYYNGGCRRSLTIVLVKSSIYGVLACSHTENSLRAPGSAPGPSIPACNFLFWLMRKDLAHVIVPTFADKPSKPSLNRVGDLALPPGMTLISAFSEDVILRLE